FQTEAGVVDPATGQAALETMRELYGNIDKKLFHANPIAVAEYMSTTDDYWYCPFAYGYSNYSRDGYARHRLEYADLVFFDPTTNQNQTNQISPNPTPTNPSPTPPTSPAAVHDQAGVGMPWLAHRMANSNHPKSSGNRIRATDGDVPTRPSEELQPAATAKPHREPRRLRSTIGGTGLSISATSRHPTECLAFAQWIVSPECQSTFYTEHGGQPGHRQAWLNEKTNRLTHNYFYTVLPAMERGYMRPRYHGYLYFQDHGGDPIREYLLGNKDCRSTLQCLDQLYHESLKKNPTTQTV
ncbi:MAG TPA: hypothetical protein VKQ52_02200, partial [Puia sp.]|nr:hypothetical protein [Puia sp.]